MKYLIPSLLLLLLVAHRLQAQGICDSVISINPIQPVCQGTGYAYLATSHSWGEFSGPGTSPYSPYLDAEDLNPGTYNITYTIDGPGGCQVQASSSFEVLPAIETFASVQGKIDCSNPNSTAMVIGFLPPNGVQYNFIEWEGPQLSGLQFFGQNFSTKYAGTYKMIAHPANNQTCPAYAFATVPFENNQLDINIVSCSNCNAPGGTRITLDTFPSGWDGPAYSLRTGFFDNSNCRELMEPGLLKATLTNQTNGCISQTQQNFSSLEKTPSVSAGSNLQLWCGGAPHLLAATEPKDNGNGFSFYWKRPDGTTFPASWGSYLQVTEPGTYILHGENLFTGCEVTDAAFVAPAPPLVGTEIKILCDGEEYMGHTQTGNYTDSLILPNGCKKVQFTKLIVLAPLEAEAAIAPDNGQQNGSIALNIVQGWAPFVFDWSNGEQGSTISGLVAGFYTVSITDANGCVHVREYLVPSGKPSRQVAIARSLPTITHARLFPNPVAAGNAACTLEFSSNQSYKATLLLQDVLGRSVHTRVLSVVEGKNVIPIEESLPAGVYNLMLRSDSGNQEVGKLVVGG